MHLNELETHIKQLEDNNQTFWDVHYDEIFKPVDDMTLLKEIKSFKSGKGKLTKFLGKFMKPVMFKGSKKGELSLYYRLTQHKSDMAGGCSLRNCAKWLNKHIDFYDRYKLSNNAVHCVIYYYRGLLGAVPTQFNPKYAAYIYEKYGNGNKHMNIFDPSCGWGSRMAAALLNGHNYYGTDPNSELHNALNDEYQFLINNNQINDDQICKLYKQGSEIFIPELGDMMDIVFTSPPYFNLEIYSDEQTQSCNKDTNFNVWIDNYMKPTIDNSIRYLKKSGYLCINSCAKLSRLKYNLIETWRNALNERNELEYITTEYMTGVVRPGKTVNEYKEPVIVYRKR